MLVKEIKLQEIIKRKIEYIERSRIYEGIEFENVKKGEIKAYREIIVDIENIYEEEIFINKYLKTLGQLQERFETIENNGCASNIETEQLSGYNNAIVFVLTLLNPKYEFEID